MKCFKTYDVRGVVPEQLNPELAAQIALAFATVSQAREIAVGHDPRLSSPSIYGAVTKALAEAGLTVWELGLCGTEECYFASCQPGVDAAIMITASHNPIEYNGMKMVKHGANPMAPEEFQRVKDLSQWPLPLQGLSGERRPADVRKRYFQILRNLAGTPSERKLRVACNAGNGGAGLFFPLLEEYLEVIPLWETPDGSFPNGVPNPMLAEHRVPTRELILGEGADFGIAWDGDFDRCFLFDENGDFVENYHLTAFLADYFLQNEPGGTVIHDPRLTWCVEETVRRAGGQPVCARTGHVMIKAAMKKESAVYGGEMSGHHYFRELGGFDSGILPALLVAQILSTGEETLSQLLQKYRQAYRISGEINFRVPEIAPILRRVESAFTEEAVLVSKVDGLSMEFDNWRFNLRASNTEPLLRLNVEARDSELPLKRALKRLRSLIELRADRQELGYSA